MAYWDYAATRRSPEPDERSAGRASPLQRAAVRTDTEPDAPAIVHDVLRSPGQPLDAATRQAMEPRFGHDFGRVRLHTDSRAAESAQAVGALAYTVGRDVVFGAGQYAPGTPTGRRVMAHELAHVAQTGGRAPTRLGIAPERDPAEMQAQRAANAVAQGGRAETTAGAPPAVRLLRGKFLDQTLADLEQTAWVESSDDNTIKWIMSVIGRVDLEDPDNIRPIAEVLARRFPRLMPEFFARLERFLGYSRAQLALGQRMVQVPRNVFGHQLPGAAIPLVTHAIPDAIVNLFKSAAAFILGLIDGVAETVGAEKARELAIRLLQSALLTIVFPPIFLSGVAVGVVEDTVDAIRGLYHLITNFAEIAESLVELLRVMLTAQGQQVARLMGFETGKGFAERILKMLEGNILEFTYDLGRLVGPTIVYAVLSFTGVGGLIAVSVAERLLRILKPLLQRFPRLLRLAEAIAKRIAGVGRASEAHVGSTAEKRLAGGTEAALPPGGQTQPFTLHQGGGQTTPRRTGHLRDVDKPDVPPQPPAVPAQQPLPDVLEQELAATGTHGGAPPAKKPGGTLGARRDDPALGSARTGDKSKTAGGGDGGEADLRGAEHTTGARTSTKGKHEAGQATKRKQQQAADERTRAAEQAGLETARNQALEKVRASAKNLPDKNRAFYADHQKPLAARVNALKKDLAAANSPLDLDEFMLENDLSADEVIAFLTKHGIL